MELIQRGDRGGQAGEVFAQQLVELAGKVGGQLADPLLLLLVDMLDCLVEGLAHIADDWNHLLLRGLSHGRAQGGTKVLDLVDQELLVGQDAVLDLRIAHDDEMVGQHILQGFDLDSGLMDLDLVESAEQQNQEHGQAGHQENRQQAGRRILLGLAVQSGQSANHRERRHQDKGWHDQATVGNTADQRPGIEVDRKVSQGMGLAIGIVDDRAYDRR